MNLSEAMRQVWLSGKRKPPQYKSCSCRKCKKVQVTLVSGSLGLCETCRRKRKLEIRKKWRKTPECRKAKRNYYAKHRTLILAKSKSRTKLQVDTLADQYLIDLLTHKGYLKVKSIPESLILMKRAYLSECRLIKEIENA